MRTLVVHVHDPHDDDLAKHTQTDHSVFSRVIVTALEDVRERRARGAVRDFPIQCSLHPLDLALEPGRHARAIVDLDAQAVAVLFEAARMELQPVVLRLHRPRRG